MNSPAARQGFSRRRLLQLAAAGGVVGILGYFG
ncbi:MAG: twin-arginine translocation signal domain-containing protein, partial [Desulfofustis sp.]|nr:twin-arginine translocation signal domain-containing protein [Desulfofustis sp.]